MVYSILIIILDISLILLLTIYLKLKKPINDFYRYLKDTDEYSFQDNIANIKIQKRLIRKLKFKIFFLKLQIKAKGAK